LAAGWGVFGIWILAPLPFFSFTREAGMCVKVRLEAEHGRVRAACRWQAPLLPASLLHVSSRKTQSPCTLRSASCLRPGALALTCFQLANGLFEETSVNVFDFVKIVQHWPRRVEPRCRRPSPPRCPRRRCPQLLRCLWQKPCAWWGQSR
jgi:hypothetical protein